MEKTQHFTNNELTLISDAILTMQNRLNEVKIILNGIAVKEVNIAFEQLRELNSKVCGYIDEE